MSTKNTRSKGKMQEAKSSAEKLYNTLFKMRDQMQEIANLAQELASDASEYGGEISRVLREQCINYLIPALKGLVSDPNQPGAIEPIIEFLDSCPLAFIREEPEAPQGPNPVAPNGAILATPMGSKVGDEDIPQNASFSTMEDEGPQISAVPNIPEDMVRGFEKAYRRQRKENAFMDKLFREEDEIEIPQEDLELDEANIFTAQGRAEIASNRVKKSVDKVTKKVAALTQKWTINNPAPYWNVLDNNTKQNILNAAKKQYMANFMKKFSPGAEDGEGSAETGEDGGNVNGNVGNGNVTTNGVAGNGNDTTGKGNGNVVDGNSGNVVNSNGGGNGAGPVTGGKTTGPVGSVNIKKEFR